MRKAFCLSSKINYIMNLRKALAQEEADLADVGSEAYLYYNSRVGGFSLPWAKSTGRLDSKGANLVYIIEGNTIQVIPVNFLYNPDEFIIKYLADTAVLNEKAVCSPQTDHNHVVTNYP